MSRVSENWIDRVQEIVDKAHTENWGGKHRPGFREACANAHLVAQHSVPGMEGPLPPTDVESLERVWEECDRYGLPYSVDALLRHIYNNRDATLGAKDYLIRGLQERIYAVVDREGADHYAAIAELRAYARRERKGDL